MRKFIMGLAVPMAVCTVTPVAARSTVISLPVDFVSSERLGIRWVKVRANDDETVVSGFVFRKHRHFLIPGHLDVALVRQGRILACEAVRWGNLPRRHAGSASFHASLKVRPMPDDTITIRHDTSGYHCERGGGEVAQPVDASPQNPGIRQ